jgi:hypothetical protein
MYYEQLFCRNRKGCQERSVPGVHFKLWEENLFTAEHAEDAERKNRAGRKDSFFPIFSALSADDALRPKPEMHPGALSFEAMLSPRRPRDT